MKKSFTFLIKSCLAAALLLGSSYNVMGQGYLNSGNVNNHFGAGESSTVENREDVKPVSGGSYSLARPPEAIRLGESNNIVINSYNANGSLTGWSYTWYHDWTQTNIWTSGGSWTPNGSGGYNWTANPGSGGSNNSHPSGILHPTFPNVPTNGPPTMTEKPGLWPDHSSGASTDATITAPSVGTSSPWTVNMFSSKDDNVDLIQLNGNSINQYYSNGWSSGAVQIKGYGTTPPLNNYLRPTTVAIEGTTDNRSREYDELTIKDVQWYYRTHGATWTNTTNRVNNFDVHTDSGIWGSYSTPSWPSTTVTRTRNVKHTYHEWYDVSWTTTNVAGGYVDGAIQLLDASNTCVVGDVRDMTGKTDGAAGSGAANDAGISARYAIGTANAATGTSTGTDAILVFPNDASSFALRVQGNVGINMVQDDNASNANINYTSGSFPTVESPDVYLYNNSVFGVKGIYNNSAATPPYDNNSASKIHTEEAPAAGGGVIEIGPNTMGQNMFNIYSGGYLRNISQCYWECDSLRFGTDSVDGGLPILSINADDESLYIVNDGDCCDGHLLFNTGGAGMLASAISSATASGALHVHARGGNVEIKEDISLDATGNDNDVYIYSDRSSILTQGFEYKSTDSTLMLYAGVEQGCSSSIEMNGDVNIVVEGANGAPWLTQYQAITSSNTSTYPFFEMTTYNIPGYPSGAPAATVTTVRGDWCTPLEYTGTEMNNFQAVIRPDRGHYSTSGTFTFKGKDGGLLLQANGHPTGNPTDSGYVKIKGAVNLTSSADADIVIQSVQDSAFFGSDVDYEAEATGNLLLSGHTGVRVKGNLNTDVSAGTDNDVNTVSEVGGITIEGTTDHKHSASGHYLMYGNAFVNLVGAVGGTDPIDMTKTPGYAKVWSPAGWIWLHDVFNFEGDQGPLIVLAEGGTHGNGTTTSGIGGSVSFDGMATITNPSQSDGITQIQSKNENVNIKDDFTYTNTDNLAQSGQILIQAGTDIYADEGTNGNANGKTLTFDHFGDGQIIMEAHNNIELYSKLVVNQQTANVGEFTMKAGYKGADACGNGFTDSSFVRTPGNLTDYAGGYAHSCGEDSANIYFHGAAEVTYNVTPGAADTLATVINAYRSVYINDSFNYVTNSEIQAENHKINHHNHEMTAGNLLIYAETGNVEAVKGNNKGVDITVESAANNNGDIRIQAGPFLCEPNCSTSAFNQDYGNILFNKPLNVTNNGSGYTILQAHRDIETQVNAPAIFTHATIQGNSLSDSATLLVAGRHIETHALMKFDYDASALDGSITLQAGKMDHPGGIGAANWTCTDALCKTVEAGTNLVNPTLTTSDISAGGLGNGSILLFDSLEFNYVGDSAISLLALNGNIESDPYLHGGYDSETNIHDAPIVINHGGTGVTRLEAIDIKLHDKIAYDAYQAASDSNGQFYMAAFDSILTRNINYTNLTDTGSVFITTAKYKAGASCDVPYVCATGGPGIHQGHIVLGYGADCDNENYNDRIIFDFAGNTNTEGANLYIKAGYEGFTNNKITGKGYAGLSGADQGKGYGGNITFDFMQITMAAGSGTAGGYTEISTPNGNIWGKDSLQYRGKDGHLLIDAGLGSIDDEKAIRWGRNCPGGNEEMLNTEVPDNCEGDPLWRTGNIMLKGGSLNFADGTGNVTFRTREGFIDVYDKFTVDSMQGHLLKYAGSDNSSIAANNEWGDVSERDFKHTATEDGGSVFFGADDNIMMNYGNSNDTQPYVTNATPGYDVLDAVPKLVNDDVSPFYSTTYGPDVCYASFNVNKNGYLWYRTTSSDPRKYHKLYRGCEGPGCSPNAGECLTKDNGARDLMFNFAPSGSGGLATVAANYIDMFTKFTYYGGTGSGLHSVPGMGNLRGENVRGYGLYLKSQNNGVGPEKRRATCEGCGSGEEWTYLGFHDDARIYTHNQKSLLEAPVVEFFGHAELNSHTQKGSKTDIDLVGDSLIFHDSMVIVGTAVEMLPFTQTAARPTKASDKMPYGVVNDHEDNEWYKKYGPAIEMEDRNQPVIELGYQRCYEPLDRGHNAPSKYSKMGRESHPTVGGDVVVAFKHNYVLPIQNTIVANHARISFIHDNKDALGGGEFTWSYMRTDLLRIRNHVEFYTDHSLSPDYRRGNFTLASDIQINAITKASGMFLRHLHMEPGSELSLDMEETKDLAVIATTTVGGYGTIHEDVSVEAYATIAPGYASLMQHDCTTPDVQGKLTIQNLRMEKDSELRVSLGNSLCKNEDGDDYHCMKIDTLHVRDSVEMRDHVPVQVLVEDEFLTPGCYLFMIYEDTTWLSREYVKNLELEEKRHGDYHLTLDFSEVGKVYLCVTTFPVPVPKRYIDLPQVTGVTTNPNAGRHYAAGSQDFSFTATFSDSPLKVWATGYYSGQKRDLDYTAQWQPDGSYLYTIRQVTEPWTVTFGPEGSTVSNEIAQDDNTRVWAHRNTLYINATMDEVVSIHNVSGVLFRKEEIPEGMNTFNLERGMYIVTLKDGSVYKIVIR